MEFRALLVALLAFLFSSTSQAYFFGGEITTTNALGLNDETGEEFYYDLYYVSVDTPMLIDVFMNPGGLFKPYIAVWDGDFTPAPDWDTPLPLGYGTNIIDDITGFERTFMTFNALPGINYQVMASTYDYNPTDNSVPFDLGTYNFFIENKAQDDQGFIASATPIQSVPEPATWLLLGLGLIGMLIVRNHSNIYNY